MAYVTNAKGEVIYTGRTLRGTQSGVKDVQNTATVVGEEYYNVNGIKLTTPTIAILWFFSAFAFGNVSNALIHCCLHRNMPKACPYVMMLPPPLVGLFGPIGLFGLIGQPAR